MYVPLSFSWSDEIEVAPDVIISAGRDLVLVDLLFGARAVLGVDLLVAAAAKSLFGRAQDDLASARALARVGCDGLRVDGVHLRVRGFVAGDVWIVLESPGMAVLVLALCSLA